MKKIICILILIVTLSINGFSQESYLWKKRASILNSVTKEYEKYNRKYTLSETDTTLIIHVNDSLSLPFYRIFYFNLANNSLCEIVDVIFNCDSCMKQLFEFRIKSNNFLRTFKKVGHEAYYARWPWNTLMECIREDSMYIVRFSKQERKEIKRIYNW